MLACAACGTENPDGARFCNGCGAPLAVAPVAQREERKVVTVVFVDMVGSTARAEALDPEDVRAILAPYHSRLRHELERHGGVVEKFIGDAVVAVFGAPVAHEDDPERAVRAALAIHDAIAELNEADPALALEVRIGVNTGEALVDLSARPELGEAMVSGDVINTGARLQSAAPPGGLLVGAATFRATQRAIVYEAHEPIAAKGKSEPLAAWSAVSARAAFGIEHGDVGRAPLVGRERELALLVDAFERARSDRRPQLVTLVGVPGIGKSRLVHELSLRADRDPELIVWRRGRSLPYGEGLSYWALSEIVKAQAGILETDDAPVAAAKLGEAVEALIADPREAVWVERNLRPLIGLSAESGTPREEAFAAHRRFLEAIAETGPAVLVFEDLHWADDGLLDFVDELTERLDAVPLLIVCTARPELLTRRPGWGGGKPNAVTAMLEQLSDADTARLLAALLDSPVLPAEVQETLLRHADGVPLFAEEYARMLAAGEVDASVPHTLQGIVTARIDALDAGEKALLQDAAVLGKVFWTDALAELAELAPWEVDERLRVLERREFVRRERRSAVAGARQYVFLHALVRDAAYGQIPRAARAERHRRAADWIASLAPDRAEERAEMLAHHLDAAISYGQAVGVPVDDLRPRAAAAWRDAGERVFALGVSDRAAVLFQRAHEVSGDDRWEPGLQLRYGNALAWAEGVGSEGERHLEEAAEALATAGRPGEAAVGLVLLSKVRWNAGVEDAELMDRALRLVADLGQAAERGIVLESVAIRAAIRGDAPQALRLVDEALAIARANGDRDREVEALNTRGVALATSGDLSAGVRSAREALALALEIGAFDTSRAYVNVASLEGEYGDLEASITHHREGLDLSERLGTRSFSDWIGAEVALDDVETGAWDEAVRRASTLVERWSERDVGHYMEPALRVAIALVTACREGSLDAAAVSSACDAVRSLSEPQTLLPVLAGAAEVHRIVGRVAEADALVEELVETVSAGGSYGFPGSWVVTATLVWTEVRRVPVPDVLLGGQETRWSAAAGHLARGDAVAAAELLREMGAVVSEAAVREVAADLLAKTDAAAARDQLARAREIWGAVRADARLRRLDGLAATLRTSAS